MCVENRISERGVSWSGHQIEDSVEKEKKIIWSITKKLAKPHLWIVKQTQLAGKSLLMFIGELALQNP